MFKNYRKWLPGLVALTLTLGFSSVAGAQLGGRTAEEWVKTLDTPQRIANLKIDEVVARLQIKPGQIVTDIGAGSGLFEPALSAAVSSGGTVYAVDIDQALIDHIAQRAKEQKTANVRVVLGGFTDPRLPVRNVDLALINDVLHHIDDRATYLKSLAGYMAPTGRIAVVDYHPEQSSHKAQPELIVSKEQAAAWMAAAGFTRSEEIEMFTDKWFIVYSR